MPHNIQKIVSDLEAALARVEAIQRGIDYGIQDEGGLYSKLDRAYQHDILTRLLAAINNNGNSQAVVAALKRVLAANWTLVQGTALCYTSQPDSVITGLLCDVAEYVAAEENKVIAEKNKLPQNSKKQVVSVGVISALMPTVATDSIGDAPHLAPTVENGEQDIDIKTILKTHIVGRAGQYLIPVACLNNYDESVGFQAIDNPYYDYQKHADDTMARLDAEEISRLVEHSPLTRAVFDAQKSFETYANEQSNLLGHLRSLETQLYYNSVGGVGGEEQAGAGAYLAIFNFFSYHDSLGVNELALIPAPVRAALEQIREYASNKNNIGAIGSCLATRRSELKEAMRDQEIVLSGIGLKGETRERLIADSKEQLEAAAASLLTRIEQGDYTGSEKLGISLALVRQFNLTIPFNLFTDLNVLKTLSADEISAICGDENYQGQIVGAMGSVENLVVLSIELSPTKLQALLNGIGPQVATAYLVDGEKFAVALLSLDQERRDIYWQQYHTELPRMVKSANDFSRVFSVLTAEQQADLYSKLNPADLIKSVFDLVNVLKCLDVAKRETVFDLLRADDYRHLGQLSPVGLSSARLEILHTNLAVRLAEMSADSDKFVMEFYWAYAVEFAKVAAMPAIKKYYLSPFESSSTFFATVGAPAIPAGLGVLAALATIGFSVSILTNVLRLDFSASMQSTKLAVLSLAATAALALVFVAVTILAATSLVTRSVATGFSCLDSSDKSDADHNLGFQPW